MGLTYQATKGHRVKRRGFFGVTTFDGYWWSEREGRWIPSADANYGGCSTHRHGVRSVRAFARRLREWSRYLPAGVEFIFVSCYRGHDIQGRTR